MTDEQILAQASEAGFVSENSSGKYYSAYVECTDIKEEVLDFGKAMFAAGVASAQPEQRPMTTIQYDPATHVLVPINEASNG